MCLVSPCTISACSDVWFERYADLAKLINRHLSAKFEPDLVRFILPFLKKIQPQICIMENIF